jgi:hypothetical protein
MIVEIKSDIKNIIVLMFLREMKMIMEYGILGK